MTDDATRVRQIIEVIRECDQRPTFDAVSSQFRFETGRTLPEVWRRAPPAWLRRRIGEDDRETPPHLDHQD